MSASQHWLIGAALRAGFPDATESTAERDTEITQAWASVAKACGVDERRLVGPVAGVLGFEKADFEGGEAAVTKLVPANVARRHQVFPLKDAYDRLIVAACDPFDVDMEQTVRFVSGRQTEVHLASPGELAAAVSRVYSPDEIARKLLPADTDEKADGAIEADADNEPPDVSEEEAQSNPVVKLTNLLLREAVRRGASDIHLQPVSKGSLARFRIDGVLRNFMRIPAVVFHRVVSRIKIMASLDITIRRQPQDGRARIRVDGVNYDLRVSTVPTRGSEKVVIRIPSSSGSGGLDRLGVPAIEMTSFRELLTHREGIAVVTGPTGSGKTTTLYAALREISTESVNVMTVEDPIEYEMPGLTQIQVESRQGVTFASALRSILRQDPDVIFVGEIRDQETAEIAVQASLTGHFVLATLHTNSAVGTVRRMTDLGLERRAIAETLVGAVAQRLARRICPDCAQTIDGPLTDEEERLAEEAGIRPVVRAVGCERCGQSGYRGRIPFVEVFTVTPDIGELIFKGASAADLQTAAVASGMRSLRDAAFQRVLEGVTTLEEVNRVVGSLAADEGEIQSAPLEEEPEPPEALQQTRALVVDDDDINRTVVRALLDREGHAVTEVSDGAEALAKLEQDDRFTIMILDLDMPNVSGLEVLQKVRSRPETASLPVIILTGTNDDQAEVRLMEQGADDYIRKPLDPSRFLVRVRATLRRAAL